MAKPAIRGKLATMTDQQEPTGDTMHHVEDGANAEASQPRRVPGTTPGRAGTASDSIGADAGYTDIPSGLREDDSAEG